jgi:hypothetical protein
MTGPSPLPPAAGTAHPHEVIYREMCAARLWTSHYDIPDSEEQPVRLPVYELDEDPPQSERSPFAADEDPEPLSHVGDEEA